MDFTLNSVSSRGLLLAVVVCLAGCGAVEPPLDERAEEEGGASAPDSSPIAGFPVYPESSAFCDGRVYPSPTSDSEGRHIVWKAFATESEPGEVIAYYDDHLKDAEKETMGDRATWRFYEDDRVSRALSVEVGGSAGPWNECEAPDGTRTVIMQSSQ